MNYALDAIWWRLRRPEVRSLAALLVAPDLWQSPHNISVRDLLGDSGFRLLLQWDDTKEPLPTPKENERLGRYAERLLHYWFENAPHSRLLAAHLPVVNHQRTLGELDFIVELNGKCHHIELCCKYYGLNADGSMSGFNPQDTLQFKQNKLQHQLALPQTEMGQIALKNAGIDTKQLKSVSLIRGIAFFPAAKLPENSPIIRSSWIAHLGLPAQNDEHRFIVLPRCSYLAPARIAENETLSWQDLNGVQNALVAELTLRDDGFWHEINRYMIR